MKGPQEPIREVKNYFCANCGISLRGSKIAKSKQHFYGVTHFGREINVYDMKEDRTVAYKCPDCQYEWKR
jgi:ssDNA-binding Zn-finger/Zn-ribbon topoisomerase 1